MLSLRHRKSASFLILFICLLTLQTFWHVQKSVLSPQHHVQNEAGHLLKNSSDTIIAPLPEEGMAACLLVLEDTLRLKEWLAYHYTVLPLSRLIIALDPLTSTRAIRRIHHMADQYNQLKVNVTIWTKDSFLRPKLRDLVNHKFNSYRAHKKRQEHFVSACMKEHQRQNASWVILTDTDEFLSFNYIGEGESYDRYDEILKWKPRSKINEDREKAKPIRERLPPIINQTIGSFLDQLKEQTAANQTYPRCYRIPGLGFPGSENATIADILPLLSKQALGIAKLETLMSLAHREHERKHGSFSKAMMDVSRIKTSDLDVRHAQTIHNPSRRVCGKYQYGSGQDYLSSIFRLHHHVGTRASFVERSGRDRRPKDIETLYQIKKDKWKPYGSDRTIVTWINKFVNLVGSEMAQTLLLDFNDTQLAERYGSLKL